MVSKEPLAFVCNFVDVLNQSITLKAPYSHLSRRQCWWLAFCVTATLLSNSVCWARFERISLGHITMASLSWMFRNSKIPWEILLTHSVQAILSRYEIREGVLVIDDSDNHRSKNTSQIAGVHKIKDKSSGGFVMGQQIVFLLLVTPTLTIPVGFAFFQPDPTWKRWQDEDRRLKKEGVKKANRPVKPKRDPKYPTMSSLALVLLSEFRQTHPTIIVRCVLADALYGTQYFMGTASTIFGGVQVISQIRSNQRISIKNRSQSVISYFTSYPGVQQSLNIRGGDVKAIVLGGARLHVDAHGKKLFVIAIRYDTEKENRYIVATDLTWRMTDIAAAYTLRWLVEVFFQDWKSYEGWCQLAKQPGVDGSRRGLILSLLTDHSLFFHEKQKALLEHKLPASTVGSLRDRIRYDALSIFIHDVISSDNPRKMLEEYVDKIEGVVPLRPSGKHMNGIAFTNLQPTPSLKYRARG